jgi:signal transduction histidine kinase
MATSSKLTGSLKDALQLTSASWVGLVDREGGKWSLVASQGLTKAMQGSLLHLLGEPTVDTWLCSAMNGGSSRSASLPAGGGLEAARLCAYPVSKSTRMLVVGVEQLTQKDQRLWRMVAALLPESSRESGDEAPMLDLLADLPYDLAGSLDRVLKAFVDLAPCQSAWLGIRRGEALDVLAEWNDAKVKGMSFQIDGNELLRRVNRTLAEVAAEQGDPEWEYIPSWGKKRGASVWVMIPLVIGQRQIGGVAMWRTSRLSHEQWNNLRDLASHIAPSVEVAAIFSEMSTHLGRLGMLNDFALTVSSAQNLDQIARRVFDLLSRAFGTEMVALTLLSTDGRMVRTFQSRDRKVAARTAALEDHPIAAFLKKPRLTRVDNVDESGIAFLNKDARSALVVPLKYRTQVIGVLTIENPRPEAFNQYDEHLMVVIASHLAGLVEYGRLRDEAEGRARSLGLIHEVVQQVIGLTDKQEMAQITADLLADYFGYELAAVLFQDSQQQLVAQGLGGRHGAAVGKFSGGYDLNSPTGIPGAVYATGDSILVNDTSQDERYQSLEGWIAASEICVPLKEGDRVFGIINVESSQSNAFTANDLIAIESLSGILSAVVASADQYKHLQNTIRQLRQMQNELKARMDAQQAAEQRLLQAAKLAAVGEMAAGIAHELNNPLTTVTGFTELVLEEIPEGVGYREELVMVQREAKRATDVVRRLLDFSRQGAQTRTRADLNEIVEDVLALTQHLIHTSGVQLTMNLAGELPWVAVDRNQIKQVLLNLIHNALQAMPDGGSLYLGTETREVDGRPWAAICVRDTGGGITQKDRERIFEPFFTTRGGRGGTGLGLSITYSIVTDHGGSIDVESEIGQGSTFLVRLPL